MYKAIHFDKGRLLVNHGEYLKKHRLIYRTPAYKGYEGIPIGDGDMGGMLFNTERSIEFVINKIDAIDYCENGNFKAWEYESEESNTSPVSCGRISISDGMPSFDKLYLEEFDESLDLSEACVQMSAKTPFSEWETKIHANLRHRVIEFSGKTSSQDRVERRIKLERWGSRNFFHYYEQIKRNIDTKLLGTTVGEHGGNIYLKQQLRGGYFVVGVKLISKGARINILNSREIEYVLDQDYSSEFKLLITVVVGKREEGLLEEAMTRLDKYSQLEGKAFIDHCQDWEAFWSKSFIGLSEDYLENIYYLNLYALNCCCLGKYPPTFGGLWSWYGDSRNWGHYYHWNHQQTYWGVHASNHGELSNNYYEYRYSMLNNAYQDGEHIYRNSGAVYTDISNYNGYQAFEPDTISNYTVGPQLAMDFYRHYRYTMDLKFLRDRAYPIMKACGDFYLEILEKEHGEYYIRGGSTPYESYLNLRSTITDWSMIKALFSALIETVGVLGIDQDRVSLWSDIITYIFKVPITNNGDVKIFSPGEKWDGNNLGYNEGEYPLSAFPACELSPVFPAGIIGLKDEGTENYSIALNTAELIFNNEVYINGSMGCSGHAPCPEVAARLGLKEHTTKLLNTYIDKYQMFPNGFTHYSDMTDGHYGSSFSPRVIDSAEKITNWEQMHEKGIGNRINYSSDCFLHMYFEASGNIMAGINEMLLQSYDGSIRVFPAIRNEDSAIFTLLAVGNFLVTSEKSGEDIRYIHIISNSGGECKVFVPWEEKIEVIINKQSITDYNIKDNILLLPTQPNDSILLQRKAFPLLNYYKEEITSYINQEIKIHNKARLGLPRDF